jgi:hypothetical protein
MPLKAAWRRHSWCLISDSLNFSAPETYHQLRGIFADADTARAVVYTDAPYYQALCALDLTSHEH